MNSNLKICFIILLFLSACNSGTEEKNNKKEEKNNKKFVKEKIVIQRENLIKNDLVPDEITAIKIAEAIWLPIYGNRIYDKKPFVAISKDSIWIVSGTMQSENGGSPFIEIQKHDAKILKVYHEK
jgi:NTF2 fold immunity protein